LQPENPPTDIYIKTGSVVELGVKITDEFIAMRPFQSEIVFPVYQSTIECPQYTDVDCSQYPVSYER
jgi:hypothetical protein